jgi:hypothetical protein
MKLIVKVSTNETCQSLCQNSLYNHLYFNIIRKKQSMGNVLIVGQKDRWMWYQIFQEKKNLSVILVTQNSEFLTCNVCNVSWTSKKILGVIVLILGYYFGRPC